MSQHCQSSHTDENVESKVPIFSTQEGLKNINLESKENTTPKSPKKKRAINSEEEDILLVKSWLNVSKDAKVGTEQKSSGFWERIAKQYEKYRGSLPKKSSNQLNWRWAKINAAVQKFVGCYNSAKSMKQSGTTEDDIVAMTHAIYKEDRDNKKAFNSKHAWQLLKNEAKWGTQYSTQYFSKKTKMNASREYSSSSNPKMPTSDYNPETPTIARPMGQKATKRKGKGKAGESSSNCNDEAKESKLALLNRLTIAREQSNKLKLDELVLEKEKLRIKDEKNGMQILYKDVSSMTNTQLRFHYRL